MTKYLPFHYDNTGSLTNQKCFIITGSNLKFLIAWFNSNLFKKLAQLWFTMLMGETYELSKIYVENIPIPKISKPQQLPFEILVDCILFAKENNMKIEADTFESMIDGMVYDLYFEEDMRKANCYITDRISEVVKPFKEDDTDEFKIEYIKKLHTFCRNDKNVFRGLIHRRNVKVVKIINGEKK